MKNLILTFVILGGLLMYNCKKDAPSERFNYLTGNIWMSDSLLADGEDASGPGQILEDFKGEVKFNTDGTGVFGIYSGTWSLGYNDTEIIIASDSLDLPLTSKIVELTSSSLKITTAAPNKNNPSVFLKIRMTFKAK